MDMDMCDCDSCGGVRNCGCGPKPSSGGCAGGACSITSQTTAMGRSASTVHHASSRLFRGTGFGGTTPRISGYEEPQLKVGPRVVPPQHPIIATVGGDIQLPGLPYPKYAPTGQSVVPSAMAVVPSAQTIVHSAALQPAGQAANVTMQPNPGKPGEYAPPGPAQQSQSQPQPGISEDMFRSIMNVGSVGIQGLQSVITTAMTQAGETDRARIAAETQRQIGQLQQQGLLSQQQASDAMAALHNAQNSVPPPPPPVGWWDGLSTPAKVGVGAGAAAGIAGIAFLVYKATR